MGYLIVQVDDEPGALLICRIALERGGHRVIGYKSSDELVEVMKKTDSGLMETSELPDIFILDVMMPGIDGYALTRMLRQSPIWGKIPIVILSARGDTNSIKRGMDAGADDYLLKPILHHDLNKRVQETIEEHQWRSVNDGSA